MTPLLARLDKWLKKHRPRFYKNLRVGASPKDLDALSKVLRKPVPTELAVFLSWHNGQGDGYVGYFVDHWLLMDTHGIAVAKAELDASAGEFAWKKTWLPFLDDDEGNYVVLDTRVKPSQVMAFWIGEKAEKLSASLGDWLMNLVEGLEAGAYQEDSERGTLTRRV